MRKNLKKLFLKQYIPKYTYKYNNNVFYIICYQNNIIINIYVNGCIVKINPYLDVWRVKNCIKRIEYETNHRLK